MEEKVDGEAEDLGLPPHIHLQSKLFLGRESQPLTVPGLFCFPNSYPSLQKPI